MANNKTILVLGAGFTAAFFDEAPLMWDDYSSGDLLERCRKDSAAYRLLETARAEDKTGRGRINIEALMTRLHSGMPYDRRYGNEHDIQLLLRWLKDALRRKIEIAREVNRSSSEMERLADYCVKNNITCITFNYDDLFDECLAKADIQRGPASEYRIWQPDRDYGFVLSMAGEYQPSEVTGPQELGIKLLKLHGSLSWRPKLGAKHPFGVDDLMHWAEWPKTPYYRQNPLIQDNLEREPFIVPPVLLKSELVDEPVLSLIWSRAYYELSKADEVIFVGYSLPFTDVAARHLFSESLNRIPNQPNVLVVNHAEENQTKKRDAVIDAYAQVVPWLDGEHFDFRGAAAWAKEFIGR